MAKSKRIAAIDLMCGFVMVVLSVGVVQAEENLLKGIKLGFGFDRGLGVVGSVGKLNGFIGNDGVSVDYILMKNKVNGENPRDMYWYVAGGGFGDWDGDFGVRLPVGGEIYFEENLDAYAQVIPRLRVNNDARFGLDFSIGVRYQF